MFGYCSSVIILLIANLQVNYSQLVREIDEELKDDLGSGRHLPRIVDKTLRLLNLKQVISEVETSVMSKVSCTACRAGTLHIEDADSCSERSQIKRKLNDYTCFAGVGLLLHYIRTGKTTDDIIKLSFQFCVSLNIQTHRVCDGITQLFGVSGIISFELVSIKESYVLKLHMGLDQLRIYVVTRTL